ncbi:hypothetical protein I79_007214 [Cricetulus griseus]|uniref:Uncharacterized protein n=1 Tax=Cricetulus griseus TaxID=10029 RepID=G3H9Y2_CRIGR|nr:hypothetical protein I79_007214 [Cricetulus griseus]
MQGSYSTLSHFRHCCKDGAACPLPHLGCRGVAPLRCWQGTTASLQEGLSVPEQAFCLEQWGLLADPAPVTSAFSPSPQGSRDPEKCPRFMQTSMLMS